MKTVTVVPAYGKDYNSKKEVELAYEAGKDFKIMDVSASGRYINKQDCEEFGVDKLKVRYSKRTKAHFIEVADFVAEKVMIIKKSDPTKTSCKTVVKDSREYRKYMVLGYIHYEDSVHAKKEES